MNIAIISSIKDPASTNIKENLINNFDFNKLEEQFGNNHIFQSIINNTKIKLYTINSELIFIDDLDKNIDADVFIFISKHRAAEGRASLTCHAIGNFGKAEKGGKEKALCSSHSIFLKNMFIELNNNVKEPYEVTLEATHHGPYLEKPVLFVELGSNEKYWGDKIGGKIVAQSIINVIKKYNNNPNTIIKNSINKKNNEINFNNKNDSKIIINNNSMEKINKNNSNQTNNNLMNGNNNYESTFVIGGGHYNHVANKAMLKGNLAVGHICAKYNLENLDENLIKEAIGKIIPKPKFVLLDWKGLGKEKASILEILDKNNIEYRRSDKEF
ncbi:MAG: hypothetical protein IH934_03840 [Nanoarchaeota archaeon]|nr:hypothetical protein [Nanoarchaeota archaeon]